MVKKAKKRGVKPGTKREKYKRTKKIGIGIMSRKQAIKAGWNMQPNEATVAAIKELEGYKYTPSPLSLCGQLEDAILLLETRVSNAIAKINSLM